MLTTGEIVTAVDRFYVGVEAQANDILLREKTLWFAQEGAERLWTWSPNWWRLSNSIVSITGAQTYGTLPADFAQLGQDGNIYISSQPSRPALAYRTPAMLNDMLERNTNSVSFPEFYTLSGRTAAGLPKIRVALTPGSTITLAVDGYVRRAPFLIDCPTSPSVSDSGSAGSLTSGAHRWRLTFVTATGETEGGVVSESLTTSGNTASLTGIPLPPSWLTGLVTSKKLYRTEAGGYDYLLVATLDVSATTYTDAIADGSLTTACPNQATAVGTGIEQFPEDWQRSLVERYAEASVAQKQGDLRDRAWYEDWEKEARRLWATLKQGQNVTQAFPRFGTRSRIGRYRTVRERLMQS